MAPNIILKVKEEIERLVASNFIRPARYVEWLSNIISVMKKNGKLRICVDFRNWNNATPKDEYPMSVADLLVDGVAGYQILSMMDGHSEISHLLYISVFSFFFWESNHFAVNSLRSRHTIRCFLSFSLVLSFKDLYLVLTCICFNIEDNVNFKLGGMLIV